MVSASTATALPVARARAEALISADRPVPGTGLSPIFAFLGPTPVGPVCGVFVPDDALGFGLELGFGVAA
ncbi:MAG TPA: hypothetical protein VFA16_17740 [Mycobacterium sp.]|uniref:hypothetical protein n=1 Tax=Mycobacterium sp. TaxID=1785 RepID=UPI002D6293F0|nr:hypothetical protein [Mycobacterium sp.]HZU49074.1 hypothetical protein [Mycobacterium sp.]